jgi:hypothetical protein
MPVSDDARARQLAGLRLWPPAPVGNERGTTHAAYATAKTLPVGSKAEAIAAELAAEAPLRDRDGGLPVADRTVIEMLALCLCRIERIAVWVDEHGEFDEEGTPRPVLEMERRLRNEAAEHCASLGLTPRSRVALGLDLARGAAGFDLAQALSDLPEDGGGSDG